MTEDGGTANGQTGHSQGREVKGAGGVTREELIEKGVVGRLTLTNSDGDSVEVEVTNLEFSPPYMAEAASQPRATAQPGRLLTAGDLGTVRQGLRTERMDPRTLQAMASEYGMTVGELVDRFNPEVPDTYERRLDKAQRQASRRSRAGWSPDMTIYCRSCDADAVEVAEVWWWRSPDVLLRTAWVNTELTAQLKKRSGRAVPKRNVPLVQSGYLVNFEPDARDVDYRPIACRTHRELDIDEDDLLRRVRHGKQRSAYPPLTDIH